MKNVKTNNKGFSLVELIIVIAIMAILIGVLAPQYMKYVEKSRISADTSLLDSIYSACTTAASDPAITDSPGLDEADSDISGKIVSSSNWGKEVLDTLKLESWADAGKKLKSKAMKGKSIEVKMDKKGNFTASVVGADGKTYSAPAQVSDANDENTGTGE